MSLLAVDWGPVGVWAGAIATFLAALIALHEFVNVLYLREGSPWRIVTFDDADFIPVFTTELAADRHHVLQLAVFADDAETVKRSLAVKVGADEGPIAARLLDGN